MPARKGSLENIGADVWPFVAPSVAFVSAGEAYHQLPCIIGWTSGGIASLSSRPSGGGGGLGRTVENHDERMAAKGTVTGKCPPGLRSPEVCATASVMTAG